MTLSSRGVVVFVVCDMGSWRVVVCNVGTKPHLTCLTARGKGGPVGWAAMLAQGSRDVAARAAAEGWRPPFAAATHPAAARQTLPVRNERDRCSSAHLGHRIDGRILWQRQCQERECPTHRPHDVQVHRRRSTQQDRHGPMLPRSAQVQASVEQCLGGAEPEADERCHTLRRNPNKRAATSARAPPPHISIRCFFIMPRVWWQLTAIAMQNDRITAAHAG